MEKLNLQQILKETSESVSNGHSVEKLEEFKKQLKYLDKEDKISLKYAIKIIEEVIRLKKKRGGNNFKKIYISILLICLLGLVSGSISYMENGEMFLQGGGGYPLSIKDGLNITTGHLYISAGDLHLDGNLVHDQGDVSFSGGNFSINTKDFFVDISSGNVGIGISNPTTPLSIMGNGGNNEVGITQNQVGGTNTMELTTKDSNGNQATRLLFRGGNNVSDIEFYREGRGGETISMFIEGDNGFVGIGTISPTKPLQVNGDTLINGELETDNGIIIGGDIQVDGTVDSRDIATDGTKLDGISTGADVSTKEFFLPAGSGILDNNAVFTDDAIVLPDDVAFARAYFNFHLPSDFSSMASGYPKIVMMPGTGGGGNVRIAFNSQSGGVGEQLGSSIDNIAEYTKAVSSTSNIIIEEDISNAFDGLSLSAGDSVSFYVQRDSDDSGDTFNGGLDIVGVIIKYN